MSIYEQHGAICPKCRSPYRLCVTFIGTCDLTPDGTADAGDHEYDGASACACSECGWSGTMGDATGAYDALPDVVGVSLYGERKVMLDRSAIAAFNARWPGSKLDPARRYWFEFDADGDLADSDVPEHSDGPEATALADDCKAYLFDAKAPEWAA